MPQLDFSTYASQIFWLFICFGLLYFMMANFALPRVREVLQTRQSRMASDLAKAEKLKKEAEAAKLDLSSSLSVAHKKAHLIIQTMRAEMAEKAKQANAKLDKTFAVQEHESEARQAKLQKEATEQMTKVSAEVAQHILKKILNMNVDLSTIEKTSSKIS